MHKQFTSLDDLFENIIEDKNWTGANAGQINRYPVRFVLFDSLLSTARQVSINIQ